MPRIGLLATSFLLAAGACGQSERGREPVTDPPVDTEPSMLGLDDTPDCQTKLDEVERGAEISSLAPCWRKLFRPLESAPLPFPREGIADAGVSGFAVAPGWLLTVLHVWSGQCFFESDVYGNVPKDLPHCGRAILVGGHPRAPFCRAEGVAIGQCVDQVPIQETFDVGLFATPTGEHVLPLASTTPGIGDPVFVIGMPMIVQRTVPEYAGKPLVSYGKVVKVKGRAIVVSNLAHPGNSGGPILNSNGEVVGIVYTGVRLVRSQGVHVDSSLSEWNTVGVAVDDRIRASVSFARSAATSRQ